MCYPFFFRVSTHPFLSRTMTTSTSTAASAFSSAFATERDLKLLSFSDSHKRAIRYALNFVLSAAKENKIINVDDIKTKSQLELHALLDSLTMEQVADALISKMDSYKNTTLVQVARVIKSLDRVKYRRILNIVIPKVGWKRPKRIALYKKMDMSTHRAIESLVLDVTSNPWQFQDLAPPIILCICTNLRMNELKQLTRSSLMSVLKGERVRIRIKKRARFMRVLYIKSILEKYLKFLLSNAPRDDDRIVTISRSSLNKRLRQELLERGASNDELFGIQCLRVFNTTRLIANLPLSLVARFNRHRRMETTSHFYDTGNVVFEKEFKDFA